MLCLMVVGGDSLFRGCEFESWHQVQDGPFLPFTVVLFEKTKEMTKRPGCSTLEWLGEEEGFLNRPFDLEKALITNPIYFLLNFLHDVRIMNEV